MVQSILAVSTINMIGLFGVISRRICVTAFGGMSTGQLSAVPPVITYRNRKACVGIMDPMVDLGAKPAASFFFFF